MPGQVQQSGGGGTPDDNSVTSAKIQDGQVSLADMADLATDKLIGRVTAGTGVPEAVSISDNGQSLIASANYASMRGLLDLEAGTDFLTPAAIAAAYQPLDADLTTLASATAAGLALMDDASAAAQATTLGLGTGDSPQFTAINLGHASDTTITRVSAGLIAVEGVNLLRTGDVTGFDPSKRYFDVYKTPGTAATLSAKNGTPTHTVTGATIANLSDSTGAYLSCTDPLAGTAFCGVQIAATECVKLELNPVITFTIKTEDLPSTGASEALSARIWVGVESAFTADAADQGASHALLFRYAPFTDSTAFWRVYTNDGGATENVVTTSVAIAANTRYVLKIDASNPASVVFSIDGVVAATVTTDLPTATQAMGCVCGIDKTSSSEETFRISTIAYQTN